MSDANITDALFAVAEQWPDAIAIIDGERPLSFRTVRAAVLRAAA